MRITNLKNHLLWKYFETGTDLKNGYLPSSLSIVIPPIAGCASQ